MTGYVIVLPCIDRWVTVDLRTKAFSVPPQMVCSCTNFRVVNNTKRGYGCEIWGVSQPMYILMMILIKVSTIQVQENNVMKLF